MNTLVIAFSMVLVAIVGSLYFKYQDHRLQKNM